MKLKLTESKLTNGCTGCVLFGGDISCPRNEDKLDCVKATEDTGTNMILTYVEEGKTDAT